MFIKRSDFHKPDRIETKPGELEGELFSGLLWEAYSSGPSTVEVIKHIWLDHLLRTESEINTLFRYGLRLSSQRLEAACRRAVFHKLPQSRIVKSILVQRLDVLPLTRKADVFGQYMLF